MARIKPTDEPWKDCPRAQECCSNNCPITKVRYKSYSCDLENKCNFGKSGRKRIGKKWKLKNLGLTGRELAGKEKWDSLPEEVKKARIAKLREKSPIDRKSTRLNSSHIPLSRMPSSA